MRHLRRGKFKAQQFIFAIKATRLGWFGLGGKGRVQKKKGVPTGEMMGDCVLGVSVLRGFWERN